jgi:hypothetical protein
MDPESRFQIARNRMTDLQRERAMDRLAASARRAIRSQGPARPPRVVSILRRVAAAFAA